MKCLLFPKCVIKCSTATSHALLLQVMEVFQPEAIVVCGGADSLSGDRLGCFNLSLEGHAGCMEFLAKFNVPMLILGGGRHMTSMFCLMSE